MEDKIYTGLQARLREQAGYLQDHGHPAIAHVDWWANQVDEALAQTSEGNEGIAWPRPAVFVEFSAATATKNNGLKRTLAGTVTLHVVQDRTGSHSEEGSGTQDDFLTLLDLLPRLLDVLDGYRMPCSARLVNSGQRRDHTNRPLLHEEIIFGWEGTEKRQAL